MSAAVVEEVKRIIEDSEVPLHFAPSPLPLHLAMRALQRSCCETGVPCASVSACAAMTGLAGHDRSQWQSISAILCWEQPLADGVSCEAVLELFYGASDAACDPLCF